VTVSFQTSPDIGVVPASPIAKDGVITGYEIPDMNREVWLPTNPPQHSRDVATAVGQRGLRFRRVITML
jgi:hypothetical protein